MGEEVKLGGGGNRGKIREENRGLTYTGKKGSKIREKLKMQFSVVKTLND